MFQFETNPRRKGCKPLILRYLRPIQSVFGVWRPSRRGPRCRVSEVQRNELGLVSSTKNPARKISPHQHACATECHSGRQRYGTDDDAQENDVDQQIGNVIFLVEISILIPGDAGVVVDCTQQRLRIALRQRARSNRHDRPSALVEEWADIFYVSHARLRRRSVMRGINPASGGLGCVAPRSLSS